MTAEQKWDLICYRLENARKTLGEVDILVNSKLWNTAVNRLYYACFYAVSALILQKDITAKTHSGTIQMFGLHFLKTGMIKEETGRYYTDVFELRRKEDYEDFFDCEEADVLKLINPAHELIEEIQSLLLKSHTS